MTKFEYEFDERIIAILINPYLSKDDFVINCDLIKKYNIRNISTTLNYLIYLRKSLENNHVKINTFISYPLADIPNIVIDQLIDYAKDKGADGIEYLPKFYYLSENEDEKFANDIERISKRELPLTLIFNKNRLKEETFIKAINISLELGIKSFQFGDGFGLNLKKDDLQTIKKLLTDQSLIKVVGKVRGLANTIELLDSGADYVGTSYFYDIFQEIKLQ